MELRDYWKTGAFICLRDIDLVIREVTSLFGWGAGRIVGSGLGITNSDRIKGSQSGFISKLG